MNDPSQPTPPAVDTSIDAGDRARPVDPSRRRLVRSGLAGSVVLGSLVSKPVLGAPIYQCTPSGMISGNLSRTDDGIDCATGDSRSDWLDADSWDPLIKGTLPNPASTVCTFSTASYTPGTRFNNTFSPNFGGKLFVNRASGNCAVTLTNPGPQPDGRHATMLEVLNIDDATAASDERFDLGRVTVVSLLNAYKFAPNYPVTPDTVKAMFVATFNGGSYQVNTTVMWNRTQVIAYLKSLYPQT